MPTVFMLDLVRPLANSGPVKFQHCYCQPNMPNPQSQSFSRSYGSILPTSLIYIVLSTRGCSPWRPAAVMSTTRCENESFPRIFKGRQECTGHYKVIVLCLTLNHFSSQADFMVTVSQKEKRTLPRIPTGVSELSYVTVQESTSQFRNINLMPFRQTAQIAPLKQSFPISQDRLTRVQLLFTRNLSPLQSSKFSFEYLLLSPRSALEAVSLRLTSQASSQPPRPPTRQSLVIL